MKTRILTSAYIVIGLILIFLSRMLTPYIFDIAFGALAVIGAVEVARVMERAHKYNTIFLVGSFPALLYVGFVLAINFNLAWQYYLIIVLGLIVFMFLLSFLLTLCLKKQTSRERSKYQVEDKLAKYALKKAINTSVILVYPTLLFASLFILNHINSLSISEAIVSSPFDYYLLLTVVLVTVFTDTFAMLIGSTVKGPKLCPLISPNKTISGAVGGLCGGVAAAFIVYGFFTINSSFISAFNDVMAVWMVAIIGIIGSVVSQCGDIFASALKRRAYVKDYGTLFPGHGGVMDRVDGLIWNAAFVLIFTLIIL